MGHPPEQDAVIAAQAAAEAEQAKKPARPKAKPRVKPEPAAAADELDPQPKQVTFREVTLDLPEDLPGTILFDLTELEASGNAMAVYRMLRSVLGPEQFATVRNQMTADDNVGELIDGLFDEVFGAYGITVGESSASEQS